MTSPLRRLSNIPGLNGHPLSYHTPTPGSSSIPPISEVTAPLCGPIRLPGSRSWASELCNPSAYLSAWRALSHGCRLHLRTDMPSLLAEQKALYCRVLPDKIIECLIPLFHVESNPSVKGGKSRICVNPNLDCRAWATPNQMTCRTSQYLAGSVHHAGHQRVLEGSPRLCLQRMGRGEAHGPRAVSDSPLSVSRHGRAFKKMEYYYLFVFTVTHLS